MVRRLSAIFINVAPLIICLSLLFLPLSHAKTDVLRIATAANFAHVLKQLTTPFEESHHIKVDVISAATGTLYLQIKHGAPFDVFLAADSLRPKRLVDEKLALKSSLTPYAIGQLSFYSEVHPELTFEQFCQHPLSIKRLAIANPEYAPYGIAAKQALQNTDLWAKINQSLVLGININQTFQQARSQAASAGIVATSQLIQHHLSAHPISTNLYQPIVQTAVILHSSKQLAAAQQFLTYLTSDAVQEHLKIMGYLSLKHGNKSSGHIND